MDTQERVSKSVYRRETNTEESLCASVTWDVTEESLRDIGCHGYSRSREYASVCRAQNVQKRDEYRRECVCRAQNGHSRLEHTERERLRREYPSLCRAQRPHVNLKKKHSRSLKKNTHKILNTHASSKTNRHSHSFKGQLILRREALLLILRRETQEHRPHTLFKNKIETH